MPQNDSPTEPVYGRYECPECGEVLRRLDLANNHMAVVHSYPTTDAAGADEPRQQVLKLMRYANTLTPAKLDEPIDPMVNAAVDAWISELAVTDRQALRQQITDLQTYKMAAEHPDKLVMLDDVLALLEGDV